MPKFSISSLIIVLTICCLHTFGQSKSPAYSQGNELRYDTTKIAILELEEALPWGIFDRTYKSIKLTQNEAYVIDSFLLLAVSDFNSGQKKYNPHNSWNIDLNSHDYRSQVVAAINKNGQREIWVNCFCSENHPDWKTRIIFVQDGATCYFNFKINLTKRFYYDFSVNSAG